MEILYRGFKECGIDSSDKLKKLKTLEVYYEHSTGEFKYRAIMHQYVDNYRSLWDIQDLEVWQQLANLFDLNGHKLARVEVDGEEKIVCYYECWHAINIQGTITYKKRKHAVDSPFNWYINENCIVEDDINEANDEL